MSFLRNKERQLKSATSPDAIHRVLDKYVDFDHLYLCCGFEKESVEFIDHPENDILVLRFSHPVEENTLKVNTVVQQRYIDFDLEIVSPAAPGHRDYSYVMRIARCSIALDKREHERTRFADTFPAVSDITTIKVRESEKDFRKSLSVSMIVEEFIGQIEGADYKRVVFKDDKNISPPVTYVMESENPLFIPDTSDTDGFFRDNDAFFEETNSAALREELHLWLQNNSASIRSILVMMLPYHPLVGHPFPLGYLVLGNGESRLPGSIMERMNDFIENLSERIRNGNLVESRAVGKIIDVSVDGVMIEIENSSLIDKLVAQNVILFEMIFRKESPILVSGRIIYIFQGEDGKHLIGVDFRGSRFGPQIRGVLPNHIRRFYGDRKG